jgi:hypothetical protein
LDFDHNYDKDHGRHYAKDDGHNYDKDDGRHYSKDRGKDEYAHYSRERKDGKRSCWT